VTEAKWATRLSEKIQQKEKEKENEDENSGSEISTPEIKRATLKKRNSLVSLFESKHELKIAEQLTYLTFKFFKAVTPQELYTQSWKKKNNHDIAPNILYLIENFHRVSRWVIYQILCGEHVKTRVRLVKEFMVIALHCIKMNNYETLFAISLAMSHPAITRLKRTWSLVKKSTRWKDIDILTSSAYNYKAYRTAILDILNKPKKQNEAQIQYFVLPYFGLYLKDLTFIEDGNPNNTDYGAVNYEKLTMIARVIKEIHFFQQASCPFQPISLIQESLMKALLAAPSFDKLFDMSQQVEPLISHSEN